MRRPFGVTAIAVFQLLSALVVLEATGILRELYQNRSLQAFDPNQAEHLIPSFFLGLVRLVTWFGLWRLKKWAWTLTMILTGLYLFSDLVSYFSEAPNYISMAINVVIVFYLNQRDVRHAFEGAEEAAYG